MYNMDLSGRISRLFRERKSRTLLIIGVIALFIPLMIYYILDVRGVFDGRSRAGLNKGKILGDLNGDGAVDLSDLQVFLEDYRSYRSSDSIYEKRSDMDGNKVIDLADFSKWLSAYWMYKNSPKNNGSKADSDMTNNYIPDLSSISAGEELLNRDIVNTVDESKVLEQEIGGDSSTTSDNEALLSDLEDVPESDEPIQQSIDLPDSTVKGATTPSSGTEVTAMSAKKYLHVLSVGEFIVPNFVTTPANAKSSGLRYQVSKGNNIKLVEYGGRPQKLIVALKEGNSVLVISSKSDPKVKIIFYIHVVKVRAVPMQIGEKIDFNAYGNMKWKILSVPNAISMTEGGVVTGVKRGVALIAAHDGKGKEISRILVGVDLTYKPTYRIVPAVKDGKSVSGYSLRDINKYRPVVDTYKAYTKDQKNFLESYLTQKVESVGGFGTRGGKNYKVLTGHQQGSRAGAVAAARFLALEFQYGIPYSNMDFSKYFEEFNGKKFDLGNFIDTREFYKNNSLNVVDLYGYKLNIHDANDNKKGLGCWGCSTGLKDYAEPFGLLESAPAFVKNHGLHCATYVGWSMYNGGLNFFSGMKDSRMVTVLEVNGYLPYNQKGAEYIELFDILDLEGQKKIKPKDRKPKSVTKDQWDKVKIGDLTYRFGHIGMIIGLDRKNGYMYVAHQRSDHINVDRIPYYNKTQDPRDFGGAPWEKIILMEKVYERNGYISSMW